jgi:hypothetical protein
MHKLKQQTQQASCHRNCQVVASLTAASPQLWFAKKLAETRCSQERKPRAFMALAGSSKQQGSQKAAAAAAAKQRKNHLYAPATHLAHT